MWCFHIPENCEIAWKCHIFLKSPARFVHWGEENVKPIQMNRARRARTNGYDFICFEWLDPLRKGKSTSQCWLCFFVKALFSFLKNMKIAVTGPFSHEYSITKETGEKCLLHIVFGFCCFLFYLSEKRERASSFNLLFDHFCRYFAVLWNMKASHWSRNQSIRTSSSSSIDLYRFEIHHPLNRRIVVELTRKSGIFEVFRSFGGYESMTLK